MRSPRPSLQQPAARPSLEAALAVQHARSPAASVTRESASSPGSSITAPSMSLRDSVHDPHAATDSDPPSPLPVVPAAAAAASPGHPQARAPPPNERTPRPGAAARDAAPAPCLPSPAASPPVAWAGGVVASLLPASPASPVQLVRLVPVPSAAAPSTPAPTPPALQPLPSAPRATDVAPRGPAPRHAFPPFGASRTSAHLASPAGRSCAWINPVSAQSPPLSAQRRDAGVQVTPLRDRGTQSAPEEVAAPSTAPAAPRLQLAEAPPLASVQPPSTASVQILLTPGMTVRITAERSDASTHAGGRELPTGGRAVERGRNVFVGAAAAAEASGAEPADVENPGVRASVVPAQHDEARQDAPAAAGEGVARGSRARRQLFSADGASAAWDDQRGAMLQGA